MSPGAGFWEGEDFTRDVDALSVEESRLSAVPASALCFVFGLATLLFSTLVVRFPGLMGVYVWVPVLAVLSLLLLVLLWLSLSLAAAGTDAFGIRACTRRGTGFLALVGTASAMVAGVGCLVAAAFQLTGTLERSLPLTLWKRPSLRAARGCAAFSTCRIRE